MRRHRDNLLVALQACCRQQLYLTYPTSSLARLLLAAGQRAPCRLLIKSCIRPHCGSRTPASSSYQVKKLPDPNPNPLCVDSRHTYMCIYTYIFLLEQHGRTVRISRNSTRGPSSLWRPSTTGLECLVRS